MKKILLAFIILLIGINAHAFTTVSGRPYPGGAASSCYGGSNSGLLIYQNLEGAGYDNGETTWAETAGTNGVVDEDDTTATVLRGSQQLKIYAGDAGQTSFSDSPTFSATTPAYGALRFKLDDGQPGSATYFLVLYNSTTVLGYISVNTNGKLICVAQGDASTDTGTHVFDNGANGIHYIWWDFTGSATDATLNVYISESTTKPASPDCTSANGNQNLGVTSIRLISQNQQTRYFDQILVDNAAIGDLCD